MAAIGGGAGCAAIKSLTTGGFVRGGFVSCSKVKPATNATAIHFNFLFNRVMRRDASAPWISV
jgi:hypothetical protein